MNHNAENFTSLKLLLAKHRKAKFAGKSLRARTIFAQRRPKSPLFRRSRCMGGHLTDLINMATVRSGTGKDSKKTCKKDLKCSRKRWKALF